jgi:hypothetical protein
MLAVCFFIEEIACYARWMYTSHVAADGTFMNIEL